jgi:hypothetical protein
MGRGVDRRKLAEWQERLRRYEQTHLTAAEFCKREEVSVTVFRYWRRRIRRAAAGEPKAPPSCRQTTSPFTPIEIIPRRSVFVRFPGGTSLEIPDDRIDLVRLALDRLTSEMEAGEC